MNLSESDREQLIELAKLEMELGKVRGHHAKLSAADPAEDVNREFLEISEKLSSSRAEYEDSELEAKRIGEDLGLVEKRIERDKALIEKSSNASELSGLQHEMATLESRKSNLETELLEKMEQQESISSVIDQLTEKKQILREKLAEVESSHTAELAETRTQLEQLEDTRSELLGGLPGVVSEEYQRKAKRGVPVGMLQSGACSACHLNLNATELGAIRAKPADELVNCPECQAILIR